MVPFGKPGKSDSWDVMATKAAQNSLQDAGIDYTRVQQAYVGCVYADSTAGQMALYPLGATGIPIINVNNNCSTGSSALYLARQAVESGIADCVLALGFEQMPRGAIDSVWPDRPRPMDMFERRMHELQEPDGAPIAAQLFGGAGVAYMEKYGARLETFAKISVKARRHASQNPYAVFRDLVTLEEVLASPHIYGPLTRLQCCPPTCGAAAAVVCSEDFARMAGVRRPVTILSQSLTTDLPSTMGDRDMMKLVGYDMARQAVDEAYAGASVGPEDIDVVELHDCFTSNELISYEALRLVPEGGAERMVVNGDNTYGGRYVVNPSGGLLSKGHPLGATGLAQCAELVWQLRSDAGPRQVSGARTALQHNLGLGGACVVTIYQA